MKQHFFRSSADDLPDVVKKSLGIGRFKIKVFLRPDGEIIAKVVQDISEITIRLISISKSDRAKSIKLTETELRKILLMAKDVRKMTGQQSGEEYDQAWLEED